MKNVIIVLVVLVIVALAVGGMYVGRRNEMVVKNETVKSAWAQVDVVLQRRADLIPNLVETVKGYAAQEQTVFHDIAAARSASMCAYAWAPAAGARMTRAKRRRRPSVAGTMGGAAVFTISPPPAPRSWALRRPPTRSPRTDSSTGRSAGYSSSSRIIRF